MKWTLRVDMDSEPPQATLESENGNVDRGSLYAIYQALPMIELAADRETQRCQRMLAAIFVPCEARYIRTG